MLMELSWPALFVRFEGDKEKDGLTSKRKDVSRGREANRVDPTAGGAGILATNGVEGQLRSPHGGGRSLNILVRQETSLGPHTCRRLP